MRRKSERNKAKASPEKKVEKPTRKSTRRRGKRSPSTSPDRDNSNDGGPTSSHQTEQDTQLSVQLLRSQTRESEKICETTESNVTSTETVPKDQDTEGAGVVWKVARADASPGEIQKLKLCRQRNMSETSDASSSRKRSSKWHEGLSGGEGVTEEMDSADERATVGRSSARTTVDSAETTADEITSVLPGRRESSEEVSDCKEFPPEIAKAVMSDDKPTNIDEDVDDDDDRHEDEEEAEKRSKRSIIAAHAIDREPDDNATAEATATPTTTADIPKSEDPGVTEETEKKEEEPLLQPKVEPIEPKEELNASTKSVPEEKIVPTKTEEEAIVLEPEINAEDTKDSKESSSSDGNVKIEDTKVKIEEPKVEKQEERRADTSEENTDDDRKEKITRISLSRTMSRRKHRDKYRDSSNSDSAESEDEPDTKRNKRINEQTEAKSRNNNALEETQNDNSSTPETRSETPLFNDPKVVKASNDDDAQNDIVNDDKERSDHVTPSDTLVQTQNNYKPAKVNLKRSFAARPSVDSVESKKDAAENDANDLANQDKENHASSDQHDLKSIPKRRRWGTILASTDPTPAFSVSTESLKVLVPGAKPLSINEVRLSKDDDEDRERRNQREKRYITNESAADHKPRDDIEKTKNVEVKKDSKGDNHIASRRKISIVKDTQHAKSPSPPAAIPTSILLIKNLVRPFTLNQIRELLSRTGTIVENGFWMDRIKSKCFVEYSNEDQAFETRQALHGISWPVSNPKRLLVEYATKEDMELARELSKDQPTSRKAEPLAANDGWQQDWARDERTNSTTKVTVVREWDLGKEDGQHFAKDKERDKKELEKKRRRSRSPPADAHLPAPARKFKKKEDDPPPAKLLDDLFRKTKASPCIYWLPLTNEQIVVKEEMRRQHMAEHARRLEEMRRAERNHDSRRRRSPRK